MSLNLAQLRAFHGVATEGSFTTAARALGVTQPTVSAMVKALEETYGVRLCDRHPRGIAVTEIGQSLLQLTNQLFSLEQRAEDLLSASRELQAGQIKVGADGPHHVMPILAEFCRRYPGISVSLDMGNAGEVLQDLRDYRIDVAVLAQIDDDTRLYAAALRRSAMVVFVSRTHRWARRASIRLSEVAGERLIVREAASVTRQTFDQALAAAGLQPRAVMQIESREAVREAVAAGLGIGVVSEAEFDHDTRLRALRIRDMRLEIAESVVCLEERRRLRVVKAFLDVAREIAAGDAAAADALPVTGGAPKPDSHRR